LLKSPFAHTLTSIGGQALANCGERGAARKANLLLQRMEDSYTKGNTGLKPDLLSYNTVLDVFSKEGDAKSAERLLEQMLDRDDGVVEPDSHSYTSVRLLLRCCSSAVFLWNVI
jgi:pentatricopeptide repeat protein